MRMRVGEEGMGGGMGVRAKGGGRDPLPPAMRVSLNCVLYSSVLYTVVLYCTVLYTVVLFSTVQYCSRVRIE